MKTINALSARSRLGTILDEVSKEGIHYIIERLSRPLVVVVPFEEYQETFKQRASKRDGENLLHELASFRKKYGKQLSGKKGTTHLVQKVRAERTQHFIDLLNPHEKNS